MIRYALACASGHPFESWFPSSESFEEQAARGFVACPVCGETRVEKQIMAPSVARTDRGARETAIEPSAPAVPAPSADATPADVPPAPGTPPPAPPVVLLSEAQREMRAALRRLRAHIEATAENVGRAFPDEARRIHAGDAPERPIIGQADRDEVAELIEEGVPIAPLPILPDERN
ncbi:DUF1178 family protein [Salinarimonas chemoclinalis]|uniref:DUF1178 family protein n=1 Tax=Salinarimonas chemoclinalis TaxID=3241599 RepID=UPI003557346C